MAPLILLHGLPKIFPQLLQEQWPRDRYDVRPARKDKETWEQARLLLLGAEAGADQLAAWRAAGLRAPVLSLAAARDDLPVTETLPPPFKLGRLIERMEYYAQLPLAAEGVIACGACTLEVGARKLRGAGGEQSLTEKEAALLALLAGAPAREWPRAELLREVWGYDGALDTHTLETHIYRLRRKLADLGGGADIVTTEAGYRWDAP